MTIIQIVTALTGERLIAKRTSGRKSPSFDEVARLAYRLYDRRGRQDGDDLDDWLSAERALACHDRRQG